MDVFAFRFVFVCVLRQMDYLVEEMGLSVYDVLTFPAYFSYPLDTVIEPRTEFLIIRYFFSDTA